MKISKLLVATRSEIAIRVLRAANELGIRTVAIDSQEDRFALHRSKADEAYLGGGRKGPTQAYLDMGDILRIASELTTSFVDDTPELFHFVRRRDRATKLLRYLAEVVVNGNPEVKGRTLPALPLARPVLQRLPSGDPPPEGSRETLKRLGPRQFSQWMRGQQRVLVTDITMRDAHQSLFATRMRTADMLPVAAKDLLIELA